MKIAVSNIALPAFDHRHLLPQIREMGATGLEIAPAHTWRDINECVEYGRAIRAADLTVTGFQDVLAGRPDLGLFKGPEIRAQTVDFLVHLSSLCRDLGGRTLILGSRWRGDIPESQAWNDCRALLEALLPRIEDHGTRFCFAPLGPEDGDFCVTAAQCRMLTYALDEHPALGLHLAATALLENNEMGHAGFAGVRGRLDHFHADEPGLAMVGSTGCIDHVDLRRHLAAISYFDWVSVVQRPDPGLDIVENLRKAVRFTIDCYLPLDTR